MEQTTHIKKEFPEESNLLEMRHNKRRNTTDKARFLISVQELSDPSNTGTSKENTTSSYKLVLFDKQTSYTEMLQTLTQKFNLNVSSGQKVKSVELETGDDDIRLDVDDEFGWEYALELACDKNSSNPMKMRVFIETLEVVKTPANEAEIEDYLTNIEKEVQLENNMDGSSAQVSKAVDAQADRMGTQSEPVMKVPPTELGSGKPEHVAVDGVTKNGTSTNKLMQTPGKLGPNVTMKEKMRAYKDSFRPLTSATKTPRRKEEHFRDRISDFPVAHGLTLRHDITPYRTSLQPSNTIPLNPRIKHEYTKEDIFNNESFHEPTFQNNVHYTPTQSWSKKRKWDEGHNFTTPPARTTYRGMIRTEDRYWRPDRGSPQTFYTSRTSPRRSFRADRPWNRPAYAGEARPSDYYMFTSPKNTNGRLFTHQDTLVHPISTPPSRRAASLDVTKSSSGKTSKGGIGLCPILALKTRKSGDNHWSHCPTYSHGQPELKVRMKQLRHFSGEWAPVFSPDFDMDEQDHHGTYNHSIDAKHAVIMLVFRYRPVPQGVPGIGCDPNGEIAVVYNTQGIDLNTFQYRLTNTPTPGIEVEFCIRSGAGYAHRGFTCHNPSERRGNYPQSRHLTFNAGKAKAPFIPQNVDRIMQMLGNVAMSGQSDKMWIRFSMPSTRYLYFLKNQGAREVRGFRN